MTAAPPTVVTLINGTFARDAPWVDRESALARYLRAHLGNDSLVEPLRWEGGNSTASRHEGAEKLATHITNTAAKYPGSPHFLVAHSHGGNVAVQALKTSSKSVRGLVCLNTPFLHSRPRSFFLLWVLSSFLPSLPAFVILLYMYFSRYRPMYPDQYVWPLVRSAVWAWIWLPIGFALRMPWDRATRAIERYFDGIRNRATGVLVPDTAPPVPVIALTVPGDEAYLWLRVVDGLSGLVRLPMWVAIASLTVAVIANNFQSLFTVAGWFVSSWRGAGMTLAAYSFAMGIAAAVAYFIAVLLIIVVIPVVRGHILSYGEGRWESVLFDITVKPYAVGMAADSVVRLPARTLLMRHSALYSQQRVAELITQWIERQLTSVNTAASSPSPGT